MKKAKPSPLANPNEPVKGLTNPQRPSDFEIHKLILDSNPRKDSGANSHINEYVGISLALLSFGRGFTVSDFLVMCRPQQLPVSESKEFYDMCTTKLCKIGRLTSVSGAYDEMLFIPS